VSGDESEPDRHAPKGSRARRKSGRGPAADAASHEDASLPASPEVAESALGEEPTLQELEEEWVKMARTILGDKSVDKLSVATDGVARRRSSVDGVKKGLDEGSIKTAEEFYSEFLLLLVNNVMANKSGTEVSIPVH
jgi:hypothetical protein